MTVHEIRRVVTGQVGNGKSVFVSEGNTPRVVTMDTSPGNEFFLIWSTEATPQLPTTAEDPTMTTESLLPGPLGTRFIINRWPPETEFSYDDVDPAAWAAEMGTKMPGIAEAHETEALGMHTTDSIDYGVVLSGEIWIELDDGAEAHLGVGDCIVQNGARHAWRNRSTEECIIAFVLVGAHRSNDRK